MRRRIPWILSMVVLFTAVLSACGSKNADSVVKDLNKVASKLESYQGSGKMILHTGQQPLEYKVEVWYQKPQYYRIALTNEQRDITQIVLRNDDGVFVLTPRLNKSYRFQSDWPENQGQVYLYQTLLQSIALDNSRQFTTDKDAYVFDVQAGNYQNGSFARQKIWLAKSDYKPQQVQVTDTNANLMVEVKFDSFEFDKKFDKSAFDMQQNMGSAPGTGSSSASGTGSDGKAPDSDTSSGNVEGITEDGTNPGTASGNTDGAETDGAASGQTDATSGEANEGDGAAPVQGNSDEFQFIEPDPESLPEGVELRESPRDLQLAETQGVMLRYTGTYDFTLVESMPKDEAVSSSEGIMLDLGATWGLLSGEDTTTLTWTYDGIEYRLTTADLPQEDMIRIAQSLAAQGAVK
ncbi:LolA family protein [Cohnella thailandensis]|uniref:Outer membrane lipoprotein carrier protein LolA n=1 Tax=Cohnella thailandensis TaxID=557557 RepID=A0A841SLY1_9BACL|nr:outer membrane lipoprotein carrier protein LolA [Cohnella thailandensis]MBB6633493.1 outer membrane lipoprotein carrier protein LolA [Cohnella thailandensis]MBP1974510.1 outer membrane lipoprotein-sorting protein [Cohnella thailandensis]